MFYILLLSGLLNIVNFRETGTFWNSKPSKYMLLAIIVDSIAATMLVWRGIMIPQLPSHAIVLALVYTIIVTLLATDTAKIAVYRLFGTYKTLSIYVTNQLFNAQFIRGTPWVTE